MRKVRCVSSCLSVLLLLASVQEAHAAAGWLEKLSGPGGFVFVDLIFPWSLSTCDLELSDFELPLLPDGQVREAQKNRVERNVLAARGLGLEMAVLNTTTKELLGNRRQCELFIRDLGVLLEPGGPCEDKRFESDVIALLDAVAKISPQSDLGMKLDDDRGEARKLHNKLKELHDKNDHTHKDEERIKAIEKKVNEIVKRAATPLLDGAIGWSNQLRFEVARDQCQAKIGRFGASRIGLFGSAQAIPQIEALDGKPRFSNWFVSLSLGLAETLKNDLDYGTDFSGSRSVIWLSAYPALEKRFLMSNDWKRNLFVNFGPAVNYFSGTQFKNFLKLSARVRGGIPGSSLPIWCGAYALAELFST